jgi:hypothetical protein
MQLSLVTAYSFMSAYAVAKQTQRALNYGFCEHVYRPVRPTCSVFMIHLLMRVDAKTRVFWERPQNELCAPAFPVHTR